MGLVALLPANHNIQSYMKQRVKRYMKSKLNQRSLKKLQIFISDSDEEDPEIGDGMQPCYLQDRLTTKQNTYSRPIKYDVSLGLNLIQIFFKASKRRLKMQCFMRIKFLYGLGRLISRDRLNASQSSRSSLRAQGPPVRYNNILTTSILDSRDASPGEDRGRLMNSIMEKLQDSGSGKVEVERVSVSMDNHSLTRNVSNKIDNLERILKDIKKCKEENYKRPNAYAMKRAKVKGQKIYQQTHLASVKPYSAVVIRPQPEIMQLQPRKLERSIIAKIDNMHDNISPISQKTENSSIMISPEQQQYQKVAQNRKANQNFKEKENLTDQLYRMSRELNELKKLSDECIVKHALVKQNEKFNYPEQPYRRSAFQQNGSYPKPETQQSVVNQYQYTSEYSQPQQQRPPQSQSSSNNFYKKAEEQKSFPYRITNPERFQQTFYQNGYQNGSNSRDLRKPSTQSQIQIRKSQDYQYLANTQERGRRLVTQPSIPAPLPQQQQYCRFSPQVYTSPKKLIQVNSQSSLVYSGEPYRTIPYAQQLPIRTIRPNNSSSGSHLIDNRVLSKGYPQSISYPQNRQCFRQM